MRDELKLGPIFTSVWVAVAACSSQSVMHEVPTVGARPVALQLESAAQASIAFTQSIPVRARLVHLDDASPVASAPVTFSAQGAAKDSVLLVDEVMSAADGTVENEVLAGLDKTSFEVVIESPGAKRVVVAVEVVGQYKGRLDVRYGYSGIVPVAGITTRLHKGVRSCSEVLSGRPPTPISLQAMGAAASVAFDDLPEKDLYTVTAYALGPRGTEVAAGCAVAPPIEGRDAVSVTVPLELRPASLVGTYDLAASLHLGQALPNDVNAAIRELSDFFSDPAQWLAEELVRQVAEHPLARELGLTTPEQVASVLEDVLTLWEVLSGISIPRDSDPQFLDDGIAYFLLDQLPPWALGSMVIGEDLIEMISNLSVGGKLTILSVAADGAVVGRWEWNELLLRWRYGLPEDTRDDVCAGRVRLGGEGMGLGRVAADIKGRALPASSSAAASYHFASEPQKLALYYGETILFALENFILPSLAGQDTIPGAIESLLGCDSVTQQCGCDRVGGWLDDALDLSGAGSQACLTAVSVVATALENHLRALSYSGDAENYFLMSLDASMTDEDRDLQIDALWGTTTGTVVTNGQPATFGGELRGDLARGACESDSACSPVEACQLRPDVLDDCASRLACALR